MTAACVMVLGCTSGAGKSWLATALCRWYADRGLRVAPFKAQNMSNHARVVALESGGAGEIGSAQYFQALAARAQPDVRMNPVLLKPETDVRSQVVVMGRVRTELASVPWRERSAELREYAESALAALREDYDVVVIEGAGSPAEINLASCDYVNTGTALAARAACLLVADIDRGGAFAHLHGTHALMDERVRERVRGFVLNRFRGDAALLSPAPERLQQLTGVPTVAVLPMLRDHGLPEEDAVPADADAGGGPRFVVIACPHASNLDEFEPLRAAGARLSFARDAGELASADWLIVPGSKNTRADLAWLRTRGLDELVAAHAAAGRPLLAVCGGLQILGARIEDPLGLEGGDRGAENGLALLPIATRYAAEKRLARARGRFGTLGGPWAPLSGLAVEGYEIHHGVSVPFPEQRERYGRSEPHRAPGDSCPGQVPGSRADELRVAMPGAGDAAAVLAWQRGSILATYLHGLFENPSVVQALLGAGARSLDGVFDTLAAHLEAHFAPGFLMSLLEDR